VNSPGGSPVQSSIIYDRILALKAEHPEKRIVTVATDTLASGAYFVASATDRIYVNRSTIAGSIGVVSDGFGFTDALKRLGVERRVFTAGENKARLDPFIPLTDADKAKIADVLSEIHKHFIDAVKTGRGDRLSFEAAGLFEGDVWTGNQALEMGLVDALGDLTSVLDREFGVEHARDYTIKPAFLERIMKYAATTAMDEISARNQLAFQ
jgi:protease-4